MTKMFCNWHQSNVHHSAQVRAWQHFSKTSYMKAKHCEKHSSKLSHCVHALDISLAIARPRNQRAFAWHPIGFIQKVRSHQTINLWGKCLISKINLLKTNQSACWGTAKFHLISNRFTDDLPDWNEVNFWLLIMWGIDYFRKVSVPKTT